MVRVSMLAIAILLANGLPSAAGAANLGWLKGSIIERYDDRDREILGTELLNALDFQPSGVPVRWYNARTGHWGVITPRDDDPRDGATCRRVTVENHLDEHTGTSTYTVCRRTGFDWMLLAIS
jgi:surface antigen